MELYTKGFWTSIVECRWGCVLQSVHGAHLWLIDDRFYLYLLIRSAFLR